MKLKPTIGIPYAKSETIHLHPLEHKFLLQTGMVVIYRPDYSYIKDGEYFLVAPWRWDFKSQKIVTVVDDTINYSFIEWLQCKKLKHSYKAICGFPRSANAPRVKVERLKYEYDALDFPNVKVPQYLMSWIGNEYKWVWRVGPNVRTTSNSFLTWYLWLGMLCPRLKGDFSGVHLESYKIRLT